MSEAAPSHLSAPQVRILSILAMMVMLIGAGLLFGSAARGASFAIVTVLGWLLPFVIATGRPGWRPPRVGELDERQQFERLRTLVIGHRVTGTMLGLCLIYLLPGTRLGWWLPSSEAACWLLAALFWLHLMLPATLLAWRERPVSHDE